MTNSKPVFRLRDGVRISYDVRGIPDSEEFPYVNDLPSLKIAVAIAKRYPGIYGDGSTTHIVRNYAKLSPPGSGYHHSSASTHRWRVSPDGNLVLDIAYHRPWKTTRMGMGQYCSSLPKPYAVANNLEGQLHDLARIAEHLGMKEASKELLAQLHPWRRLAIQAEMSNPENESPQQDEQVASWWKRVLSKIITPVE